MTNTQNDEVVDNYRLDLPTIEWVPQEWRKDAACRYFPVDIFFGSVGADVSRAKKICSMCPVQQECLEWACDAQINHGIFGGRSPRERRNFRKGIANWEICGTAVGVREHKAKQEPLCPACLSAMKDNERKARNKENFKQRQKDAEAAQK
jgi:WhiB family transcriptional regulator, redox-sensing transcriptional regulator